MEKKQVILLKYGEVVLKGLNRRHFEKMLERDTGERKDYAARWFDTLYMTKQLGEPTRNKKPIRSFEEVRKYMNGIKKKAEGEKYGIDGIIKAKKNLPEI